MPRIGLKTLYVAKVTEGTNGVETYGTPKIVVDLVSANINNNMTDWDFSAGDRVAAKGEEWTDTKVDFNSDDIPIDKQAELTGSILDDNGVLLSSTEDIAPLYAMGFKSAGPNGNDIYVWYLRGTFTKSTVNYTTKGKSVTPQATTFSYLAVQRNKADSDGKKRLTITGQTGITDETMLEDWFNSVPEPLITVTL